MKRILSVLVALLLLLVITGCGGGQETGGDYEDDYQKSSETVYDDVSLKVRTSSASYSSGSIIVITAVVENLSDKYYAVKIPQNNDDEALNILVSIDGYELIPAGERESGEKEQYLMLEPGGSIDCTREFLTKVKAGGRELELWECEPEISASVLLGPSFESRSGKLTGLEYSEKKIVTSFKVDGSGTKPTK